MPPLPKQRTNASWFIFRQARVRRPLAPIFPAGKTSEKNLIIEQGLEKAPTDAEIPAHPTGAVAVGA
jgi:hypothetical protein